ncbi:hypothetical protein FRC10_009583 [Ceratobasidium sp. 414]|nr:hypothetical protein FRC10_009583 [Ceratobasidium sp. 414]
MSNSHDLNNQGIPPPQSRPEYTRDPEYYFNDGSAVFLVEGILFKFQASLLAPHSTSKITFKTALSATVTLLDLSDTSEGRPGATDENPVEVSGCNAWTFRLLLLALLGRPGDPAYMHLLTAAQDSNNHDRDLALHYIHLGITAARFDLIKIARWAWLQLKLVFNSATKLATVKWDPVSILAMLIYCRKMPESEPDVEYELVAFFRLILSMSLSGRLIAPQGEPVSNLDMCVKLYKGHPEWDRSTLGAVLGFTFVAILSLGHNSSVWKDQLSRDERSVFYTAHVHLVSLDNIPNLELAWINNPIRSSIVNAICSRCSKRFPQAWSASFGHLGALGSATPLQDVSKLAHLPQCRQLFAETVRSDAWRCESFCGKIMLRRVDECLNRLFDEQLVAAYMGFTE